ncbi:MAG: hypothetical protein HQM12_22670 [SAR324 cluster bacterium]|nr:hypothetical protein [SAR324 cluster bacterium]
MHIPSFNDTLIQSRSTPATYQRGKSYFEQGAVISVSVRGQTIYGQVEGSEY